LKRPTLVGREWLPGNLEALAREQSLTRGEALFRKDDESAGLYQVEEGFVRLSRSDPTGREVVLHIAGPGELVAEASLFCKAYSCDAVAATDARVRLYPRCKLLAEFKRNPEALEAFAAALAQELMALRARVELRNIRSASLRVLNFLALAAGTDGRTVALPGTLKDLASELGLSHEALYRTLNRLETEGTIARGKHEILLKKRPSYD
jgi:CRP-like cAMP-binding protein